MTETDPRHELADVFDRDLDPLAEFSDTFEDTEIDAFQVFMDERLSSKGLADSTVGEYDRTFRQWSEYMAKQGRHPACPNEGHVKGFIGHLRDGRGNASGTIQNRLMYLNAAYQYWQDDAAFPHPTDYNPVELAKNAIGLSRDGPKEPPRLTVDAIGEVLGKVTHIRDRAIIVMQLKLGMRATEVCNIQLADLHVTNRAVLNHYDEIGTANGLGGRENAIYVPHDREGNKSKRPRVLPLDDETRRVLLQYLLIRPDAGEPWLFLSKNQRIRLRRKNVNAVWKDAFERPEFGETDEHRAVTSHFGRHFFSSYWRVTQDAPRELVKYMRGDKTDRSAPNGREAIDDYLHTHYEDIEQLYREEIFKLGV